MYFTVRGPNGPGPIVGYATSRNGIDWTRRGTIVTATESWEAAGLAVSYVCRAQDGRWAIFYHAYADIATGVAAVAKADNRGGRFEAKTVLLGNDAITARVAHAPRGTEVLIIEDTSALVAGLPYVLTDGTQTGTELVFVESVNERSAHLQRPTKRDHTDHDLSSITRAKVDPSYAREADGGWFGIFTAYGPVPGVVAEFTVHVAGPSLDDAWTVLPGDVVFKPSTPWNRLSTENPTPIATGPECR